MIVNCKICGKEVEAIASNRKYCSECRISHLKEYHKKRNEEKGDLLYNQRRERERLKRIRHQIHGNTQQLSEDVHNSIVLSKILGREITYGRYVANWKGKRAERYLIKGTEGKE